MTHRLVNAWVSEIGTAAMKAGSDTTVKRTVTLTCDQIFLLSGG